MHFIVAMFSVVATTYVDTHQLQVFVLVHIKNISVQSIFGSHTHNLELKNACLVHVRNLMVCTGGDGTKEEGEGGGSEGHVATVAQCCAVVCSEHTAHR